MKWFKYTDRTSEQIVDSIKTKIAQGDEETLSQITDSSESNPFIKLIEIWGNITEQVGYYIDNYVREFFLSQARKFSTMVSFAEMFDYRVHAVVPSLGKVKFYVTTVALQAITIPVGTIVATVDGMRFRTVGTGTIAPGALSCLVSAKQMKQVERMNVQITGVKDLTIAMPNDTAENSVSVLIGGVQYIEVESLYDRTEGKAKSVGYFEVGLGIAGSVITEVLVDGINILPIQVAYTDPVGTATSIVASINSALNALGIVAIENSKMVVLQSQEYGEFLNDKTILLTIPGFTIQILNNSAFTGGKTGVAANVFVLSAAHDGTLKLTFGDGINGAVPEAGQIALIDYSVSRGLAGNVSVNKITVIETELVLPDGVTLAVKNERSFQGGKDVEGIASIKKSIPAAIGTRNRAITRQDFVDVVELVPGVLACSIDYRKDKNLRVYVYPYGGGIAGDNFLEYVESVVKPKMAVGYDINTLPAGEVKAVISITAYAKTGYNKENIKISLKQSVSNVIGWEHAVIKETKYISDIYDEMESIQGVTGTMIDRFILVPYPEPIDGNVTGLNWNVVVSEISATAAKWLIVFSNATTFSVYQNNAYKGTFVVLNIVDLGEVKFTINENYTQNQRWQFYTYPDYSKAGGVISLMENSAIVAYVEDIDVTVIGGI